MLLISPENFSLPENHSAENLRSPKTNLPENTHCRNTRKCISENIRSRQWIPRNQIGYIWSSTSHQYKHNAPSIQTSSLPFDVRFVHPVLNYRIVRIVNSSISTQPATLQQLIVMTKSRKYDEFKVWKPKARQSKWLWHYQKLRDGYIKFNGNLKRISTTEVTQRLSETNEILCLTSQQYMHIAISNTCR